MSTYAKELKKAEKALKLKMKQSKLDMYIEWERQTKYKERLIMAMIREEKEVNIKQINVLTKRINSINSFLHTQASNLSYRLWLTLRDILTNDYMQIESDLLKGKISIVEYEQVKQISDQL